MVAVKAIADQLKLTDDQVTKMKAIWDGYQQAYLDKMRHMGMGSNMNSIKKLLKESNDATLALFTDDQSKAFTEMQGKPFKFKMPKQM